MVDSATTNVVFRPMRSPKWPNSAEPIGRARNAIPNVASEASVADGRIGRWKEQAGKHEHRRSRVNIEIEELDGRADQAGEQHLARRVDRLVSHGLYHAHQNSDSYWLKILDLASSVV